MIRTELLGEKLVTPCTETVIERGNKRLTLAINVRTGEATTRVINIKDMPRVPGSTTAVHREARDLMQAASDQSGQRIRYEFVTFYYFTGTIMADWALDPQKGAGVFAWDEVKPRDYFGRIFTARKTFHPKAATALLT